MRDRCTHTIQISGNTIMCSRDDGHYGTCKFNSNCNGCVDLAAALKASQEKYANRSPTEWAYKQACAAIETQRTRAEQAEALYKGAKDALWALAEGEFKTLAEINEDYQRAVDDIIIKLLNGRDAEAKVAELEKERDAYRTNYEDTIGQLKRVWTGCDTVGLAYIATVVVNKAVEDKAKVARLVEGSKGLTSATVPKSCHIEGCPLCKGRDKLKQALAGEEGKGC